MQDFGFLQLRVVNRYPVPLETARSAVGAGSILERALVAESVAEAVADCTLVFGTTAVGERAIDQPLFELDAAAARIGGSLNEDPGHRIALLFGSEKTGLSNEDLSHCHALLTIPMSPGPDSRHLSMNLGQAVAVCLYAIRQALGDGSLDEPGGTLVLGRAMPAEHTVRARGGEQERLTMLLLEVFEQSGYSHRHPANAREASVRQMVRRMSLDAADATAWTGVLRQFLHALVVGQKAEQSGQQGDAAG